MTETPKTFICNYCQNTYNQDYLDSINEHPTDKIILQKQTWENELVRLKTQQVSTNDPKIQQQLIPQINLVLQQLHLLELQLQTNKEFTCKSCSNKFKVKEVKKFICDICGMEITGKMLEGHVENYQLQGIPPRKWSKFCQPCAETKVILANLYCPRLGDGRDDDWDISLPQYDCECSPELNIDG